MRTTILAAAAVMAISVMVPSYATGQSWGFPGLSNEEFAKVAGGTAPKRDLTGAWDPGQAGIAGGENYFSGRDTAPFTALGKEMVARNKAGHGPYAAKVYEGNDPLTTLGDPSGFPRMSTTSTGRFASSRRRRRC